MAISYVGQLVFLNSLKFVKGDFQFFKYRLSSRKKKKKSKHMFASVIRTNSAKDELLNGN